MISQALSQTLDGPESASSIWNDPTFWVAISFVIFIALLARPALRFIINSIDSKIQAIKNQIEEATSLREEAQDLLAANKRKVAEAEKEAAEIIAQAREEALLIKSKLSEELEDSLQRREQMASDRIAQAESDAIEALRLLTVDIALDATEQILAETLKGKNGDALINEAISELSEKLN